MSGRMRFVSGLLAAVVLGAVVLPVATSVESASAAGSELLVSRDGVTFTPELSGGLFDDADVLVPRDSVDSSLWLRNDTTEPAQVRISVAQVATSSTELADSITFMTTDVARGTRYETDFSLMRRCDVVLQSRVLSAGATMRVDFNITMLDVAERIAQSEFGSVTLRAAMRDAAAGPLPSEACDTAGVDIPIDGGEVDPGPGTQPAAGAVTDPTRLGATGTEVRGWLIAAGTLLGFGLILVASRRRREKEES